MPVTVDDGVRFPDIVFDTVPLIVEIDGHAHHGGRERFEADRRRQNQLVEAGWTVLRFTATRVADDPAGFIGSVRSAIARLRSIG